MVIDRNKHNKYSTNQIYGTQSQQQQTEQAGSGSSSSTTIIYQGSGSGLTEEQKKKLDSVEEGAQVNQNAFSKVTISDGSITNEITANDPSDNVTFQGVSPIKLSLIDGVIQISYEGTSLWQLDEDGNLWTDRNVYSTKEISAYGYGEGEQPTGAQYLYELKDVDSVTATSPIDKGILQYDSTTRKWIVTDGSNIKPDLTGYATQSWVTQQLNLLVGSAPDVLDTIYEIAEALNNDPDYVKDIANNLSNLTNRVVKLEDMFEWDGDKIKAKADLYGVGEISAYGYGSGEAPTGAQYLHELKDVTLTEITAGQLLQWDGLKWVNINKDEVGLNESELDQFLIDNNYAKISDITWSNVSNKPDSFTTSISDIIDLNQNWYTILNTTPKDYITRWPQFSEITNRPNTLEGYGITDGVNSVTLTGSGNAVTSASINGHVITLTKGSTFSLSTHNHDSIYVNVTGDTMTGNLTLPIVIVNTRIQLGDAYLEYDSENKAIKLCYKDDTQTVNFYATGEISAYGYGEGTPGGGASNLSELEDVSLTELAVDDMLKWNGDKWVNIPMSTITPDLSWSNITDKPSWIGSTKPSYTFAEITSKPTTLSGYGITDAVTIDTAQTITSIKNHTKPISFKLGNTDDGIRFINKDTGGNGTGLYLLNGSGAKIAGIGFMTSSVDSYGYSFIGWGSHPWHDSSNFSVSNSKLQYKTYPILHTGNYSTTLDTRYVKKAGDTITGAIQIKTASGVYGLMIDRPVDPLTYYKINGVAKGATGYEISSGIYLYNSACRKSFGVKDNGTIHFDGNTVWHAGNDGSGSGLDADLLDGIQGVNFFQVGNNASKSSWNTLLNNKAYFAEGTLPSDGPTSTYEYGTLLVFDTGGSSAYGGAITQVYFPHSADYHPQYRTTYARSSSRFHGWKLLARTTDNVASATKLQTARTIWGQSFDGTKNVDGKIKLTTWDSDGIAIRLENSSATTGYISIYTYPNNAYTIGQNATRFVISHNSYRDVFNINNGNVGINTPSPSYKLHVAGSFGVQNYGKTITIYSENDSWCHYRTNATNGHWFGNNVTIQGNLESYGGTKNLGSNSARWNVWAVTGNFSGAVTMSSSLSVSGTLTAANGILTDYTGNSWISMATRTNLIYSSTNQSTSSAHALFRVKDSSGNAICFGGLGADVGFHGFLASNISSSSNTRTWYTTWNVRTGKLTHQMDLQVAGSITTNNITCANITASGNITAKGEVTAYSSSDIRLKTNLKELKAINTLRKINTFEYDWTEEALSLKTNKNKHDYGIIAQELIEIIPEAVTTNMYDKGYYGIDYVKLIPFTISAIKEVDDEVIILKKRVKELEDRLNKYESNIK